MTTLLNLLKNTLAIFLVLIFVCLVVFSFLYPIISGIHYWVFVAPNIQRPIDAPWSWGNVWCGYIIYQEKRPLEKIPSYCLYLLR